MANITNQEYVEKILKDETVSGRFKDYLKQHISYKLDAQGNPTNQIKSINFTMMAGSILSDEFEYERNEWIKILNGIGKRIINTKLFKNKLAILKSGELPYGSMIEEIATNPAKSQPFQLNSSTLFKPAPPDVKSVYYEVNREDKYEVEISDTQIQNALLSPNGLNSLISMIVNTVYNGDSIDEFVLTKLLPYNALLNGNVKKVIIEKGNTYVDNKPTNTIEIISKDSNVNEEVSVLFRTLAENMCLPTSKYNAYSPVREGEEPFTTFSDSDDLVLITTSKFKANLDVKFLSNVFQLGKAESTISRVITVDNFGSEDGILCILCDKKWFRIYDKIQLMKKHEDGSVLKTKYFYHHHQIISYNLLANAVVFCESTSNVFKQNQA